MKRNAPQKLEARSLPACSKHELMSVRKKKADMRRERNKKMGPRRKMLWTVVRKMTSISKESWNLPRERYVTVCLHESKKLPVGCFRKESCCNSLKKNMVSIEY